MKTYDQIVKQISALQAEAERLRQKEVGDVITRIRDAIRVYGLSASDLGLAPGKPGRKPGPKPAAPMAAGGSAAPVKRRRRKGAGKKGARAVKFRNDSGGTWGGIGKRPQWLRDAIAAGKQLSDFAVK